MDREVLIEKILTFLPILHKKIFKGFTECDITKQQMELLYHLKLEGGNPMNYYASKMMVSKPNLTVVADKLIQEGIVERDYLPEDRRVIILKLTQKGDQFLNQKMEMVKKHILSKIAMFDDKDIVRLNELVEEMRQIISKFESE